MGSSPGGGEEFPHGLQRRDPVQWDAGPRGTEDQARSRPRVGVRPTLLRKGAAASQHVWPGADETPEGAAREGPALWKVLSPLQNQRVLTPDGSAQTGTRQSESLFLPTILLPRNKRLCPSDWAPWVITGGGRGWQNACWAICPRDGTTRTPPNLTELGRLFCQGGRTHRHQAIVGDPEQRHQGGHRQSAASHHQETAAPGSRDDGCWFTDRTLVSEREVMGSKSQSNEARR